MHRGQVSIEFILLIVAGFFFLFTVVASVVYLSADKTMEHAYNELEDLGRSLQQELLLGSRMQDGYTRVITLPEKVATYDYTVIVGNSSPYNGYISLQFENLEVYYATPVLNGSFVKGSNTLRKINGLLYLN